MTTSCNSDYPNAFDPKNVHGIYQVTMRSGRTHLAYITHSQHQRFKESYSKGGFGQWLVAASGWGRYETCRYDEYTHNIELTGCITVNRPDVESVEFMPGLTRLAAGEEE